MNLSLPRATEDRATAERCRVPFLRIGLVGGILLFSLAHAEAPTAPQTPAEKLRTWAEGALRDIDEQAKSPTETTDSQRLALNTLVAAVAAVDPQERLVRVRRERYLDIETAGFRRAWVDWLNNGQDPTNALTGVEWVRFALGLPLVADRSELSVSKSITKARERRFPEFLHEQVLKTKYRQFPREALQAIIWVLGRVERADWPVTVTEPQRLELFSGLIDHYLSELPDPAAGLEKFGDPRLDLVELQRLGTVISREAAFSRHLPRIISAIAATSVARGRMPRETADVCLVLLLAIEQPAPTWAEVVRLLSQARQWKDLPPADQQRQARGVLLQAYGERGFRPSSGARKVLEQQMTSYSAECDKAHPVKVESGRLVMENPKAYDPKVFAALLHIVEDNDAHASLDSKVRMNLFRAIVRTWLAADGKLNGTPAPNVEAFNEGVQRFQKAATSNADCRGILTDELAWRPEFWLPTTWHPEGPFASWNGVLPQESIGLFVEAARRAGALVHGKPEREEGFRVKGRYIGMEEAVSSTRKLIDERLKPEEQLYTLFDGMFKSALEQGLYLTGKVGADNKPFKVVKIVEATDDDLAGAITRLGVLIDANAPVEHPAAEHFLRMLGESVGDRYKSLKQSGPLAGFTPADGIPFYDIPQGQQKQLRDLVSRLGKPMQPPPNNNPALGRWRIDSTTTLLWLTLARLHERLGEREFYRAGFIFSHNDYNAYLNQFRTIRVIDRVRTARLHFLKALLIYQSLNVRCGDALHQFQREFQENPKKAALPALDSTPIKNALSVLDQNEISASVYDTIYGSGLARTVAHLNRLDAGLDATGYSGAIGKVANWEELKSRLQELAEHIRAAEKHPIRLQLQDLRLQEAQSGAAAADARLAAHAERLVASQLQLQRAKQGVQRADYLLHATDLTVTSNWPSRKWYSAGVGTVVTLSA